MGSRHLFVGCFQWQAERQMQSAQTAAKTDVETMTTGGSG